MRRLILILLLAVAIALPAALAQEDTAPPAPAAPSDDRIETPEPVEAPAEAVPVEAAPPAEPVDEAARRQAELYENYERLVRVMDIVQSRYVQPVESEKLFEGALSGIMESLDQHSSYVPPKLYGEFMEETEQQFSGIGVTISIEDDRVKVISTIEGMPASRAGVQPGDFIIEVEGVAIKDIGAIDDVARKLKGPKGTTVKITVYRPSTDKQFTRELVREDIPVASLRGYRSDAATGKWDFMVDGELKIGYIRITKFAQNTAEELGDAHKHLAAAGLRGLIIDLRYNPGGLLDAAVAIVDKFIDQGLIVRTKGRGGIHSESFARPNDSFQPPVPLVLLVNEYSASASEVMGGALQDYGRAVLVGTRTFGKGSVQNVIPLDGHGALRLTVAYYYTPGGRLVHKLPNAEQWGLDPDVLQEMPMERQIALREEWARVSGGAEPLSLGEEGGEIIDVQLARALDILRGSLLIRPEKVYGEER